jgi:micrococcal nuclease
MSKAKYPKLPRLPKNILTAGIAVLTLIIGFFTGSYYTNQKQSTLITKAKVIRVIDGDNLELDNGKSIRLYGINCPEKGEKYSKEAIDLSTQLALNQQISIDYQPNYSTDRWGRILGYVFIDDTFLNEELVRQGYCQVTIYSKRAKLKYQNQLVNAQEQAKQDKLGKWQ